MAGRGALIKPWLFQEYAEGRSFEPDAHERVGIYRRLVAHMKEYFGDDARGRGKAFYFLPWHFDFLTRYRSASHLLMRCRPLVFAFNCRVAKQMNSLMTCFAEASVSTFQAAAGGRVWCGCP